MYLRSINQEFSIIMNDRPEYSKNRPIWTKRIKISKDVGFEFFGKGMDSGEERRQPIRKERKIDRLKQEPG